jgi:MoxR-like ATPase
MQLSTQRSDEQLNEVLHRLSTTGAPEDLDALRDCVAGTLGLAPREVLVVRPPAAPAVEPTLRDRADGNVRLAFVVAPDAAERLGVEQGVSNYMSGDRRVQVAAICSCSYDTWSISTIICPPSDGLGARIRDLLSPSAAIVAPAAQTASSPRGASPASHRIVMDPRVMRMLKLAVASSSAVLLVGPPGTGKTTLLRELLADVAYNPASYGLTRAPREPKWVTPSDTWTATDLVGGEVIDEKGRRRFRLGHVMEAIRADRWLVLDEANRAHMDRIFGGLLTWLSDQRVEVGRASTDIASPPIVLDWNNQPQCQSVRLEILDSEKIVTSEPVQLRAGSEWRLLGTYNAQDSAKVFTFGQALGRRFAQVPIPVVSPADFRKALSTAARLLPEDVAKLIVSMYAAHRQTPGAQLGAAVFLKVASYVQAGISLPQLMVAGADGNGEDELVQLAAEAYLSAAGPWLGKLPPQAAGELSKAMLAAGLPPKQWEWIVSMACMMT